LYLKWDRLNLREVMEGSKTMNNFFTGGRLQIVSGPILSPSPGDFGPEGDRPIKQKEFGGLQKEIGLR
jgi:hypothetical protein